MSNTVETYKTIELWFEILSHFSGFHLTLPRIYLKNCVYIQYVVYKDNVKKNDRFIRQCVKFLTYMLINQC